MLVPVLGPLRAGASPIDDKRAQAARLQQQIEDLDRRLEVLDEQYNRAVLAVRQSDAAVTKAQADLAAANERFRAVRTRLASEAVTAYVHGGSTSVLAQITSSDARELPVRRQYMATAAADEQRTIDELKAARQDLTTQRARLDTAQKAAHTAAAQVATSRDAASKAIAQQQATLAQVKGELTQLVAEEAARRAAAEAARARAAQLAREAAAAAAAQRASRSSVRDAPSSNAPPVGHGAGAAVAEARRQIGKPYQWGAAGPNSFDCSGLVQWAWRAGGVTLDHSTYAQWDETTHIPIASLQPGDIVFFGSDLHHDGLYVGDGQMIEAPHTGEYVRYASIWRSDLRGAGRVNG